MEKYKDILKENNIRCTHQRIEVLRYLDENRIHPTVDEMYSELKSDIPSLSKTTVYNSLEVLEKNGIIKSITLSGTELRYDFDTSMHYHFVCEKCGKIIDFSLQYPNLQKIKEEGHEINNVFGHIEGICSSCLKDNQNGKGGAS